MPQKNRNQKIFPPRPNFIPFGSRAFPQRRIFGEAGKHRLPTDAEIAPDIDCGDLDAEFAIKIFSGKSVEDVVEYLTSVAPNPYDIFESFYFMGEYAFSFYFPVFEIYMKREMTENPDEEVDEVFVSAVLSTLEFRKKEVFRLGDPVASLLNLLAERIDVWSRSGRADSGEAEEMKKRCLKIKSEFDGVRGNE